MGEWSIVMTAWAGDWIRFDEAVREVFGRKGLDAFSLTLGADKHLPAELAAGLTFEQANGIVSQLTGSGASFEIVPTEEISGVRHRASEVWAFCLDDYCFIEIDGLITDSVLGAVNAQENITQMRQSKPDFPDWKLERAINHFHPAVADPPKEAIEKEVDEIHRLASALRKVYPDKSFTFSHIPNNAVSFWQTTPESPREDCLEMEPENTSGKTLCWKCGRYRQFKPSDYVFPLFPEAEWGICDECGSEVLVRACEKLTFVGPDR